MSLCFSYGSICCCGVVIVKKKKGARTFSQKLGGGLQGFYSRVWCYLRYCHERAEHLVNGAVVFDSCITYFSRGEGRSDICENRKQHRPFLCIKCSEVSDVHVFQWLQKTEEKHNISIMLLKTQCNMLSIEHFQQQKTKKVQL